MSPVVQCVPFFFFFFFPLFFFQCFNFILFLFTPQNSRGSAFLSNSSQRYLIINGARAQTLKLFPIAPQWLTWGRKGDVFEYERRYYKHGNGLSGVQSHNRIIQTCVEVDCNDWLSTCYWYGKRLRTKRQKGVKGGE